MSSAPKRIPIDVGKVEAVDIPTMCGMSDQEYRCFIRDDGLVLVDHNNVLRSFIVGFPLATTKEQLDILVEELQRLGSKMTSRSS